MKCGCSPIDKKDILRMAGAEMSAPQISKALGIDVKNVKLHMPDAVEKRNKAAENKAK